MGENLGLTIRIWMKQRRKNAPSNQWREVMVRLPENRRRRIEEEEEEDERMRERDFRSRMRRMKEFGGVLSQRAGFGQGRMFRPGAAESGLSTWAGLKNGLILINSINYGLN